MSRTHLITGFPGFIAERILRLLAASEDDTCILLCHPDTMDEAARRVNAMDGAVMDENVSLVAGDITQFNLGLDEETTEDMANTVTTVWHLAAVYDLGMDRYTGERVNVEGTGNVLALARTFKRLSRFMYFSTAYVSGTRQGLIREDELEHGQYFKNDYELSKFRAEQLMTRAMNDVPITILRPGIVTGDSVTGETERFDGVYFMMRFLHRFRKLPAPVIGSSGASINLVPVDYVSRASVYLSTHEDAAGRTYHLTDPQPYSVTEVFRLVSLELLGREPSWKLPLRLARGALAVGFVRKFFGVERAALDYFDVSAEYDATNTLADLAGSGISCPDFADTVSALVRYFEAHRGDVSRRAKVH